MHKFVKVALGAVVGAIAGAASIPVFVAIDSVAPVAYPILGTVCGVLQGTAFDKPLHGGVAGLAVGAALIPLAGLNASSRWWYQPFIGAATGAGVGLACSR